MALVVCDVVEEARGECAALRAALAACSGENWLASASAAAAAAAVAGTSRGGWWKVFAVGNERVVEGWAGWEVSGALQSGSRGGALLAVLTFLDFWREIDKNV
jgi:hypothetical protein